jgi:hypothetical protein
MQITSKLRLTNLFLHNFIRVNDFMTERFDRGSKKIHELYGDFGQAFFEYLEDITPDFGRFIANYCRAFIR